MMPANARAQDGIVSGNVKDAETGEPMRSVTVRLKDTKKGSFSDVKGKYTIKAVAPGTYTLIFTSVG